jgi:hypothetical protein
MLFSSVFATIALLGAGVDAAGHGRRHIDSSKLAHRELIERNSALQAEAGVAQRDLSKRSTFGTATWYWLSQFYPGYTTGAIGSVACGGIETDDSWMVAVSSGFFSGSCGRTISIRRVDNGQTVTGVICRDECPTCEYGGLDLSPPVMRALDGINAGVVSIEWWFEDSQATPTTQTTTTQTWTQETWTQTQTTTTQEYTPPAPTSTYTPPVTSDEPTSTWVEPSTSDAPSSVTTSATPSVTASSAAQSLASSATFSSAARSLAPSSAAPASSATVKTSPAAVPHASAAVITSNTGTGASDTGNLAQVNAFVAQVGTLIIEAF